MPCSSLASVVQSKKNDYFFADSGNIATVDQLVCVLLVPLPNREQLAPESAAFRQYHASTSVTVSGIATPAIANQLPVAQ